MKRLRYICKCSDMSKKKIYAVNGSPRKGYNTDELLRSYLAGAVSVSEAMETEMVYLYDYDYKGCTECMACKRKGSPFYGRCSYNDGLRELLQRVSHSDGVVFGSPVYFYEITAALRSFIERLLYPYIQFKKDAPRFIPPKKIPMDFIYTMNVTREEMEFSGYRENFAVTENWLSRVFGCSPRRLYSCYTYQYKNYGNYEADLWDLDLKKEVRCQQFPRDLGKSYSLGRQRAFELFADE